MFSSDTKVPNVIYVQHKTASDTHVRKSGEEAFSAQFKKLPFFRSHMQDTQMEQQLFFQASTIKLG